jgi:uncharacterized protein
LIVADSSPLKHLSKIGRLELLRKVYGTILIPRGVWEEVVTEGQGRPGGSEVEKGVEEGWIRTGRVSVSRRLMAEGAEGADGEVIAMARERKVPLLTNDRPLAAIARARGVRVVWLTQALVEAVEKRVLSAREGRVVLRELVGAGLRVRSEVLTEVVHLLEQAENQRK